MRRIGFIQGDGQGGSFLADIFESRGGKYEFGKAIEIAPDSTPADFDDVAEFYLSLPLEMLNFRMLRFPFDDKQKLRKVIPFELEGLILGGTESVVFDSVVLGKTGDEYDVLVAYIEKETLRNILSKLSSMGIDPQIVTSVELRHVMERGGGDVATLLMDHATLSSEERILASGRELSSPTLNLRSGSLAYTKDTERFRKSLRVTAVLLLLLGLVINAGLLLGIVDARKENALYRKEMRSIYTRLFPNDRKITDELYQMKSHMKALRDKGDAMAGVASLRLMSDLAQRTIQGVVFDEVQLGRETVTIRGEAVSLEGVDRVKARLAEFLREPVVSDTKTTVDGKTRFTVVAKVEVS